MAEEDFKKIFELTKLAPSASNLQFTDYLVITDKEKKDRVQQVQLLLSWGIKTVLKCLKLKKFTAR